MREPMSCEMCHCQVGHDGRCWNCEAYTPAEERAAEVRALVNLLMLNNEAVETRFGRKWRMIEDTTFGVRKGERIARSRMRLYVDRRELLAFSFNTGAGGTDTWMAMAALAIATELGDD